MSNNTTSVQLVDEVKPNKYPGLAELQHYKAQGYNLLMPSESIVRDVSPIHRMTFDVIKISTNEADGEVYKLPFNKLGLSKVALLKMASAMGIQFQTQRLDDGRNRDYVWFQATAALRKADGTVLYYPAQKEIDLLLIKEKLEFDGKNPQQVQKEMLQIREHRLALCETKAILRAIRGIAAIPTGMTREKLERPFVVPRVSYMIDYNDPETRRAMTEQARQANQSLFGPAPQPIQQIAAPAVQQAPRYLGASSGLDDDDMPEVGYAALPEPEPVHVEHTPDASAVQPQVLPAAGGQQPAQDPQAVKGGKAKQKQAEPDPSVPSCEVCQKPLNEKEASDAAQGFPAVHSACMDAHLAAQEGGAA